MSTDYTPRKPQIAPLAEGLLYRSFSCGQDEDGTPDVQTQRFIKACEFNFYEPWISSEQAQRAFEAYHHEHNQRLGGVYIDSGFASLEPWGDVLENVGFGEEYPVGTFADYDATLNAGGERLLDARLITAVTVNPSFRRRGVLKHMMTDALARAVEDGHAVALLTASEGSIYGRFGFGTATREANVRVNLGEEAPDQLQLRSAASGRTLSVDVTKLGGTIEDVFNEFHSKTRGSVERHAWYREFLTARWEEDSYKPWDRKLRAAVHIRDDGSVGGYVVWKHAEEEGKPPTAQIKDLVAADATSYIELWRFISELDLVQRAELRAPVQSPLEYAAQNWRSWSVSSIRELLWVRILNPIAALESREWNADGQFSLSLQDPLGIAEGTFTVTVKDKAATVRSTEVPVTSQHVTLDVETLGSLYLGDVSVLTMRDAGRISADDKADWTALAASIDLPTAPFCATHF